MTDAAADRPITSTRDHEELRSGLERWLGSRAGATVSVGPVDNPADTGMSSETLLFDAEIDGATHRLVARLAPQADAVPVFPEYDLERQQRVISLVGERTEVPVPTVRWFDAFAGELGSPCLVMDRVDGTAPPDVMPYTFGDNWFFDATPEDRRRLQDRTIAAIAGIHTIDATEDELAFLALDRPGTTALERHVADARAYYDWVAGDTPIPVLERCFEHLERNPLPDDGTGGLLWGDARMGNVLYRDFAPVAVLDWEMAALGPPEVDLGWTIYLHRFFQDMVEELGMPGLPDVMRLDDVVESYAAAGGRTPSELEPFVFYAALRMGTVMARTEQRRVAFGQSPPPEHPDELVMPRKTLERMLDGSYWT